MQTGSAFRARCNRCLGPPYPLGSPSRRLEASFEDLPRSPKAIETWVLWTGTTGAFGALGKSPHSQSPRLAESSDAAEPMFAYEDRRVPGRKRVVVAPRGRG